MKFLDEEDEFQDSLDERNDDDIVGYCNYCKEAIYEADDYVIRHKDIYCVDCYNRLTINENIGE